MLTQLRRFQSWHALLCVVLASVHAFLPVSGHFAPVHLLCLWCRASACVLLPSILSLACAQSAACPTVCML